MLSVLSSPFRLLRPAADVPVPSPVRSGVCSSRKPGVARIERSLLALLVVAVHLAGLWAITRLASRPVEIPDTTPISVSLITEPAVAPAPPLAPPEPVPPAPRVEPRPVAKPAPARPVPPKPAPRPVPAPAPAAEPMPQTDSPTALAAPPAEAPPAPAESAPASPAATSAPAASASSAGRTEARFDAAYLNNPAPTYPIQSRRLREQGEVMLRVLVSPAGEPLRIELRASSGSDRLDRAAQDAVARWRFVPARQGDSPVEAWVLVPIVFKLQGN